MHAKLSASGAHRWTQCAGSVNAEEGLPNTTSIYAEEGTLAHHVASCMFDDTFHTLENIDSVMLDEVTKYVDYVNSYVKDDVAIEVRVDFSHVVPQGFGTADCIIKDNSTLHVMDLKYGMGIPVYAEDNTQLLLYAIGALNSVKGFVPDNIIMHIVQPRINNYSQWEITYSELLKWMEFFRKKALAALDPNAIRTPSAEACKWCKAKPTCPAIYNFINYEVMPLKEKASLTDGELKLILDSSKLISDFLTSVENLVYDKILSGNNFDGYKLVSGKNYRKFKDISILTKDQQSLLNSMSKMSLPTLAEIDKILTKEQVQEITYTQESKPSLVKDVDRRKSITFSFDNFID